MRETRSSGSVEGVMSNRDPYSDCCKIRRNRTGMAFCGFRTPRYPFQRYGMPVWLRFPNAADSLPNSVACSDFVHGLAWRIVPYEKRKSTSDKACPEDRLISDGSGDRISQQDRSACSLGRRAFHCNCRFDSLSPNASYGVLSRCCRSQPNGFRTGKETHKPRRDSIPLRSFVILLILDRCSH